MVEVKIYPACLKCDCHKYQVSRPSEEHFYVDTGTYVKTDNIMECEHERVCKLIDDQEPIEIGEQCK